MALYNHHKKHIIDEEYVHAQRVWKAAGCKTLSDYHDLYVTDVVLLADVFENFQSVTYAKSSMD